MSKTPVSTLLEYCVKERVGVPDWTVISKSSGANTNIFTYRVTCGSYSATGTALNKKDAKHEAAKEMLKLLPRSGSFLQSATTSNGVRNKIDSYYSPGSRDVSHNDIFVNSVGKLSEYCIGQKFKPPEYRDSAMSGPPHAPMFTVYCKIGKLEVKAAANTKKKAKHDAAQEMLDKLVRNTGYRKTYSIQNDSVQKLEKEIRKIDTLDLKIEEPSISVVESSARAKKLFPKLKNYRGANKPTNSNVTVNEYHKFFKNSYEPFVRETVRTQLNHNSYTTKKDILQNITSLLGLCIEYETLSNTRDRVVVIGKLNSIPVITDTGVGDTYLDARDQAVANLLDSIDIYLT